MVGLILGNYNASRYVNAIIISLTCNRMNITVFPFEVDKDGNVEVWAKKDQIVPSKIIEVEEDLCEEGIYDAVLKAMLTNQQTHATPMQYVQFHTPKHIRHKNTQYFTKF